MIDFLAQMNEWKTAVILLSQSVWKTQYNRCSHFDDNGTYVNQMFLLEKKNLSYKKQNLYYIIIIEIHFKKLPFLILTSLINTLTCIRYIT